METITEIELGTIDTELENTADSDSINLTAADRCDRCSAQAFVAALIDSSHPSHLLFCGHHWAKVDAQLQAKGITPRWVIDKRDRINERPSESSA